MPIAPDQGGQHSEAAETDRGSLEAELRPRIRQQEARRSSANARWRSAIWSGFSPTLSVPLQSRFGQLRENLELLPGNTELLLRAGFGWNSDSIGTVIASTAEGSYARYTLNSSSTGRRPEEFGQEARFSIDPYIRDHACVSGVNVTMRSRRSILRHSRRLHENAAALRRAGDRVSRRYCQSARRRDRPPPARTRHELMIRDMRHRSGNLFSQLLALFSQTARTSRSVADLSEKYRARVLGACGRAAPCDRRRRQPGADHGPAEYSARALPRSNFVHRAKCRT